MTHHRSRKRISKAKRWTLTQWMSKRSRSKAMSQILKIRTVTWMMTVKTKTIAKTQMRCKKKRKKISKAESIKKF